MMTENKEIASSLNSEEADEHFSESRLPAGSIVYQSIPHEFYNGLSLGQLRHLESIYF